MTDNTPAAPAPDTDGPPPWLARDIAYMQRVAQVCSTPQGRRDLREGLNPRRLDECWRMKSHLRSHIPRGPSDRLPAYLAVAALYAEAAPNPTLTTEAPDFTQDTGLDLGHSLALAADAGVLREAATGELLEQAARRRTLAPVLALLQGPVLRMAHHGVALSWPRLLLDLRRWPSRRTEIADRWMESLYCPAPDPSPKENAA
ncbi:MAG TPA: type I-E CRISPR-associated protein Cse2/CasB [Streptomyces sp.]